MERQRPQWKNGPRHRSNQRIGKATALAFASPARASSSPGAMPRAAAVVGRVTAEGGTADFVPADLQDDAPHAISPGGRTRDGSQIDILINNAAIFPFGTTAETTEETIDGVYNVNVKVPFVLVGELAPKMAGAVTERSSTSAAWLASSACRAWHSTVRAKPRSTIDESWAGEFGPSGVRGKRGEPRSDANRRHGSNGRWNRPTRRDGTRRPRRVAEARLRTPSSISRPTTPVSFTERSSPSTADAVPCESIHQCR